jgi:predicted nucleotidyltransferase
VARLDVFGSALPDDFRPGESDLNPLIEFGPIQGYQKEIAYFDLLNDLQSLLGVDVDLVMKGALTNPDLAGEIEQSRQLLYAAPFCRLPLDKKASKTCRSLPRQEMPCRTKGRGPQGLGAAGLIREPKNQKNLSPD